MLRRGYHPKEIPDYSVSLTFSSEYKPWQTLDEQIEVLKQKGCKCQI